MVSNVNAPSNPGGVITINNIRQGINGANATLLRHQLTVSKQLGVAIKKFYMIGKKGMTKAEQQEAIRVISRHIGGFSRRSACQAQP